MYLPSIILQLYPTTGTRDVRTKKIFCFFFILLFSSSWKVCIIIRYLIFNSEVAELVGCTRFFYYYYYNNNILNATAAARSIIFYDIMHSNRTVIASTHIYYYTVIAGDEKKKYENYYHRIIRTHLRKSVIINVD